MQTNILDWLEATAAHTPEGAAVGDAQQDYTWAQLAENARRAGSFLAGHTAPRCPVAFYLEKSAPVFAAMLGTVYAGCCYSVLDTRQPAARTQQVLNTLQPSLLITDRDHADAAAALGCSCSVYLLEDLLTAAVQPSLLAARRAQAVDVDPLYINFTSGSTGVPKGVTVSHRSVLDFIPQFAAIFGIKAQDILGNQAPFDFDVSVKDLYTALYTGAKVQIIPRAYFSQPTKLMDYLADHKVTILVWAVSAMCFVSIMNGFGYRVPTAIRQVLFSGEVMPIKHLNKWKAALPQARFVNLYGPTEITCNCTYYILPDRVFAPEEVLPIGHAFPNEKVFLLDENDRLVTEPGQAGELCVSGTALALGYYADPARTAQAFTQNPLNTRWYERIYRTGDLARCDAAGEFYYIGRKDFQIKHMGHRIELSEIEVQMTAVPGVERALCAYLADKGKILAFYTGEADKAAITGALREILPGYMIPNLFMQVDAMPLNKNGKIDRAALLARDGSSNLIRFRLHDSMMEIESSSQLGDAHEEMPLEELQGGELTIAFNVRYMQDVVRTIDAEKIILNFNDSLSPCVITPADDLDYVHLVLPVRTGYSS